MFTTGDNNSFWLALALPLFHIWQNRLHYSKQYFVVMSFPAVATLHYKVDGIPHFFRWCAEEMIWPRTHAIVAERILEQ